jgi:hypothetical protein
MVVDPLIKLDGVYLANRAYVPLRIGTHSGPRCPRWTPLINDLGVQDRGVTGDEGQLGPRSPRGSILRRRRRGAPLRAGRRAASGDTFTVGFMPGLIVTAEVRALTHHHPELMVDVLRTNWDDQTEVIHDGRVDVSYVRLPIDPRLEVRPPLSEPRGVVLLQR